MEDGVADPHNASSSLVLVVDPVPDRDAVLVDEEEVEATGGMEEGETVKRE